jgi:hypothetical protein
MLLDDSFLATENTEFTEEEFNRIIFLCVLCDLCG